MQGQSLTKILIKEQNLFMSGQSNDQLKKDQTMAISSLKRDG